MQGGGGADIVNVVVDGAGPVNFLTSTIDGGDGNDHMTAEAITEFSGGEASALNHLIGGDGHDTLDATAIGNSNITDW